jgi:hypothetical protein
MLSHAGSCCGRKAVMLCRQYCERNMLYGALSIAKASWPTGTAVPCQLQTKRNHEQGKGLERHQTLYLPTCLLFHGTWRNEYCCVKSPRHVELTWWTLTASVELYMRRPRHCVVKCIIY